MPQQAPRYDLSVQRNAVGQVIHHRRPIAEVARQLRCSPQSVRNWIDKHQPSLPTSSSKSSPAFLPIQVASVSTSPIDQIELITQTGLTLRFPGDISAEALCLIVRQLELAPC